MKRIKDALEILRLLGLPSQQQNERSALTLLALAHVGPRDAWASSTKPLLRVWDIMAFMERKYKKVYAANTRETIRRQTIHQFEQARLVDRNSDDPARPTNSGKNCYCLSDVALAVVQSYGSSEFENELANFLKQFGTLQEAYRRQRTSKEVPLKLPGSETVFLSPGKHNELQVQIVHDLAPRFAPGAAILYLGDTAKKHVVLKADALVELKIPVTEHDKLPDVLLYDQAKNWLFLIEAVTSHGPVSPKRQNELEKLLKSCPAERVYVTAFLTSADFRKYAADIAWETEVWIAEHPDHMIHFNGPKFLGPYRPQN